MAPFLGAGHIQSKIVSAPLWRKGGLIPKRGCYKGVLEGCLNKWSGPYIPRHRGGEVCFWPPLLWPRTFEKSTEDFFEKKPAAGEKFLGSLFWKILRFLGKNVKKLTFLAVLTVFSGFQCLHNEKKAAAGEKFGNPFFCAPEARQKFSEDFFIFVRGPP